MGGGADLTKAVFLLTFSIFLARWPLFSLQAFGIIKATTHLHFTGIVRCRLIFILLRSDPKVP